jgi:hypothetical protein
MKRLLIAVVAVLGLFVVVSALLPSLIMKAGVAVLVGVFVLCGWYVFSQVK